MTTKLYKDYQSGKYKLESSYYIQTHKQVYIPTYIAKDKECWCGKNHPLHIKKKLSKDIGHILLN